MIPDEPALQQLEQVARARRMKPRDCRDCRNYAPSYDGMAYGWCNAHKQFVKLSHPTGEFFSQCQLKSLRRVRPDD